MRGFPRRRRLLRGIRPRVAKPPAPPSLLSLIRQDNAQEFQRRLCGVGGGERLRVDLLPGFWDTTWPRLVRQCCQNLSFRCLDVLVHLTDPLDVRERPMPAHTLGWLLDGQDQRSQSIELEINEHQQLVLFERIAQSPLALRTADALRIIREGGLNRALRWSWKRDQAGNFYDAAAVQAAWRKWCAAPSHQQVAMDAIVAVPDRAYLRTLTQGFADMVGAVPARTGQRLRLRLCEGLAGSVVSGRVDASDCVNRMGSWLRLFTLKAWPLDHRVWAQWGERLCAALEAPQPTPLAGHHWVEATTKFQLDERQPFPGCRWNLDMSKVVAQALATPRARLLEHWRQGQAPTDTVSLELSEWLRLGLDIETRLGAWGLMDEDGARVFRADQARAMGQVLGVEWERIVEDFIHGLDHQAAGATPSQWSAWKARDLALALPAGSAPRRGVRM